MTPTARTLAYLRQCGHVADVVERWNPHSRTRHDWAGFVDIISVNTIGDVHFWQATSGDNMAARVKKIRESENFPRVAQAGAVWVIGWRKYAKPVDGKLWRPRTERVRDEELDHSKCPDCGGPADRGHSREVPPAPYACSKCEPDEEA